MICFSSAVVSVRFLSAGTYGETPPLPSRPWHWAQAKLTKSCPPAATVGHPSEEPAADGRGRERQRSQTATRRPGDAEVGDDGSEDERVDHDVEAVEHPANRRRGKRAARRRRRGAQPAERTRFEGCQPGVERSGACGHAVNWRPRVSGPSQMSAADAVSAIAMGIDIALARSMPLSRIEPIAIGISDPIAAAAW